MLIMYSLVSCGQCPCTKNTEPIVIDSTKFPHKQFSCAELIVKNNSYKIDSVKVLTLLKILNNEKSYSNSDCGETYKDGKIVFFNTDCKIVATVSYGCSFSQLYFTPDERSFRYTLLNDSGAEQFVDILKQIMEPSDTRKK